MLRKLSILISLVLLVCMTSSADAASMFWKGAVSTAWVNPNNWDTGIILGGGDDADLTNGTNPPHYTSAAYTVDGIGLLSVGYGQNSGTFYMDSGTLNVQFALRGCKASTVAVATTATANMSGGTIKVLGKYWPDSGARNSGLFSWPAAPSTATWTMTNGLIDTLAFQLPSFNTASKGIFNLNGGTMIVRDPCMSAGQLPGNIGFAIGENVTRDSTCKGTMGIAGGTLILGGDYVSVAGTNNLIPKYVTGGQILPYPADSNSLYHKYIVYDFDDRNDSMTTVTAVKTDFAKAWKPSPFSGMGYAPQAPTLTWNYGNNGVKDCNTHDVYFGTNSSDVLNSNGSIPSPGQYLRVVTVPPANGSFTPTGGSLTLGKTYYWRVDELYPTATKGDVWSFRVTGGPKKPSPADNTATPTVTVNTDPSATIALTWTTGSGLPTHNVYVSTDSSNMGSATSTGTTASYTLTSAAMGATYYWRVDEITAGPVTTQGDTWRFTTNKYRLVDGFETYVNSGSPLLSSKWTGFGLSLNLSNPGLDIVEQTLCLAGGVHGMYAQYFSGDNSAERTFNPVQDWSLATSGTKAISIWLRGRFPNTTPTSMYLQLKDSANRTSNVVTYTAGDLTTLVTSEDWIEWTVALSEFGTGTSGLFDITKVKNLDIHIVGGSGFMFIDEIRLHPTRCIQAWDSITADQVGRSNADLNNDCKVDYNDVDLFIADWLKTDANVSSDAKLSATGCSWTTSGHTGKAVTLDGTNGWIDIDDLAVGPLSTASRGSTISFWFKASTPPATSSYLFGTSNDWRTNISLDSSMNVQMRVGPGIATPTAYPLFPTPVSAGAWHHVALTISSSYSGGFSDQATCKLYVDTSVSVGIAAGPAHHKNYLQGMSIGGLNNSAKQPIAATIDEFRIYNKEMSQSEINAIYASGTYPADTPIIKYDFEEGSGTISAQLGSKARSYHPTGYVRADGTYDYEHPRDVDVAELWGKETIGSGVGPFRYVNMNDYALIAKYWLNTIATFP